MTSIRWDWYQGNRMVLVSINGDMPYQEMYDFHTTFFETLESVDYTVHLIVDATHVGEVPKSVRKIYQSARRFLEHPNMGYLVVIGIRSPFIRFLTHVLVPLSAFSLIEAQTLEDGLNKLKQSNPIDHN